MGEPLAAEACGNGGLCKNKRRIRLLQFLLAGIIYLALAAALSLPDLLHAGHGAVIGRANRDTTAFLWYLAWWPYAISHHINPFYIHTVWQPTGVNAAWITSIPALAIVLWPITKLWGATAALNTALLLSPALSAWAAYGMNLEICDAFWPSLFGGWLFGFSVYEITQIQYDLNLAILFILPAGVWLFVRRLRGRLGRITFIAAFAILWCFEFGVFTEAFAISVLFGGLILLMVLTMARGDVDFPALWRTAVESVLSLIVAVAVLTPLFLLPLVQGYTSGDIWSRSTNSVDLASLIMPSQYVGFGAGWARQLWQQFPAAGAIPSQVGYLGVPLILLLGIYFRKSFSSRTGLLLLIIFSMAILLSLGPQLKVLGYSLWCPLLWNYVSHLPLVDKALPFRVFSYATLATSAASALWLAGTDPLRRKWVLSSLVILTLFPNISAGIGTGRYANPPFFRQGYCRHYLRPNETVLILPLISHLPVMLWQEENGFRFSMVNGFTGWVPVNFKWPSSISACLALRSAPPPDYGPQLMQFLYAHRVGAVILTSHPGPISDAAVAPLHARPIHIGGVWLYRVPHPSRPNPADHDASSTTASPGRR